MIGRNWYQLLLMILTIFWVATAWLSSSVGQPITATFPAWSQGLWYGGLAVGATITAVGILIDTYVGRRIEQAGLFILVGISLGYGTAFLAFASRANSVHVVTITMLIALYAVINFVRARQIDREVDTLRHGLQKLAPPEAT